MCGRVSVCVRASVCPCVLGAATLTVSPAASPAEPCRLGLFPRQQRAWSPTGLRGPAPALAPLAAGKGPATPLGWLSRCVITHVCPSTAGTICSRESPWITVPTRLCVIALLKLFLPGSGSESEKLLRFFEAGGLLINDGGRLGSLRFCPVTSYVLCSLRGAGVLGGTSLLCAGATQGPGGVGRVNGRPPAGPAPGA